jgi:hypothetical protein
VDVEARSSAIEGLSLFAARPLRSAAGEEVTSDFFGLPAALRREYRSLFANGFMRSHHDRLRDG